MAKGIYIGSTGSYAGKNLVTIGLGKYLQNNNYSVGYMKPIGTVPIEKDGIWIDEDAQYIKQILQLDADTALINPITITQDLKVKALAGELENPMPAIKNAYNTLAKSKDIMLVTGPNSMCAYKHCNLDSVSMIEELDLKVIVIDRLRSEIDYDALLFLKQVLKERLIGIIFNDIPQYLYSEVDTHIRSCLKRNGVDVFAIIPKTRQLATLTVEQISTQLGGMLLTASQHKNKLVENFLIGTMNVDNFLPYLKTHKNAAIIVGGDRSDLQLVALEEQCRCLILTGNLPPKDIILGRAEELDIPTIIVKEDTYAVAQKMEYILSHQKLRGEEKAALAAAIINDTFDHQNFLKAL